LDPFQPGPLLKQFIPLHELFPEHIEPHIQPCIHISNGVILDIAQIVNNEISERSEVYLLFWGGNLDDFGVFGDLLREFEDDFFEFLIGGLSNNLGNHQFLF